MKKKVFFIVASLSPGGAQRVFWLVSQYFNKSVYDVNVVLLDSSKSFFSQDLKDVNVIDLKTIKASLSFFKLYSLLKAEKPYAVFSTGGHIDTLVSFTSFFLNIPYLIARPTNVPEKEKFSNRKARFWGKISNRFYQRFDIVVCQSAEIKNSFLTKYNINPNKLVVIPNPVIHTETLRKAENQGEFKRVIVVARLTQQKGLHRLLDIFKTLPRNYYLTIVGDGPMKAEILERLDTLNIKDRVQSLGTVSASEVTTLIAKHTLFVLPSFIEGFPNVVIESLSVGTPVVSFDVGGISEIIIDDFNGYIVEQGNLQSLKDHIITACNRSWNSSEIKKDVNARFGIDKVVAHYESLIA